MNEDKQFEKRIAGRYPDPQLSQEVLAACRYHARASRAGLTARRRSGAAR